MHLVVQTFWAPDGSSRLRQRMQNPSICSVRILLFVVQKAEKIRFVGIEVKLSAHVDDKHVKHLKWFKSQLGDRVAVLIVLYTGKEAYRRRDGVAVIPLALLSS